MKLSIISTVALATSVVAVPAHQRHNPHVRRQDAGVVTTTMNVNEENILWVDQYGNPVTTSALTQSGAAPTFTGYAGTDQVGYGQQEEDDQPSVTPSSSVPAYGSDSETIFEPSTQTGTAETTSPTDYDEEDGQDLGYSIAYSPYNADHSCKTEYAINSDIDGLNSYDMLRIYGVDCDQVRIVLAAAKRNGMVVFAGIWDIHQAATEAATLADAAKNDWGMIHSVSVGNELLNTTSNADLANAIGSARSVLEGAGYTGPVTTVDIWITLRERLAQDNKLLCNAIDYIAANMHPFFDGQTTAEEAGGWVAEQAGMLAANSHCEKDVVITESGWPTQGLTNYKAVPGPENQALVIRSLRSAFASDKQKMILFSAYDDGWKPNGPFDVEHYWGIHGTAPSAR